MRRELREIKGGRDSGIEKQVPKIDSFSSQTLSVNSALSTRFHLERFERYNCFEGER